MSSTSSVNQETYTEKAMHYLRQPLAAAAGIIPVFRDFMIKSDLQLGNKVPRISILSGLKAGAQASPLIGGIVGTQMIAQNVIETTFSRWFPTSGKPLKDYCIMVFSSFLVGLASAHPLAAFNARSMGISGWDAVKKLSVKQSTAIASRETCFVLSLRISEPISEMMRKRFGDNWLVAYGSTFLSGALGSVAGHPADTALTLWQKNEQVTSFSQLFRGVGVKARGVGAFAVCYRLAKELLGEKPAK